MATSFSRAGKAWEEKVEIQKTEIFHASLRDLTKEVVVNTPVVTGNTRKSLEVSTTGPVILDWRTKKFRNSADQISNQIAGTKVSERVWIGYKAPWASKLEPKYAMMRLAAQRWYDIVNAAAARLRR